MLTLAVRQIKARQPKCAVSERTTAGNTGALFETASGAGTLLMLPLAAVVASILATQACDSSHVHLLQVPT